MTLLKITAEPIPAYQGSRVLNKISRAKKTGVPVCQACGRPLTDALSIQRGYGSDCWAALTIAVVIKIPNTVEA